MIQFLNTDLSSIKNLRNEYFTDIKLPQELLLEWAVADGEYFKVLDDENETGYFIKSKDNVLLEFYLNYENLNDKEKIFEQIIRQHSIKSALSKTFDYMLMTCCHTFCKSSKLFGTIFRDYSSEIPVKFDTRINVRLAAKIDIPLLETHDSGLYETLDELYTLVRKQNIYMFELGGELLACGFFMKILPDRNYFDIGMWTNPAYRNKGYAAQVISYLKQLCFTNGYTPVCGCAAENTASRKTLEKNGFVSKYSVILFDF